jgi:hypothetical protein
MKDDAPLTGTATFGRHVMWSPTPITVVTSITPVLLGDDVGLSIDHQHRVVRLTTEFAQLMNMKYPLASRFNKPVFVAETA